MGFLNKIGIHRSKLITRMIVPYKEVILEELKSGIIDQDFVLVHSNGMFHLRIQEDFTGDSSILYGEKGEKNE